MSSQPHIGERSRSCVLCNKLIDVNKDKIQEIKENGLSLLKETAEKKAVLRFDFLGVFVDFFK